MHEVLPMSHEQGPFCPTCEDPWDWAHDEVEGCPYEGTTRAAAVEFRNALADLGEVLWTEFDKLARAIGLITFMDTAELFFRWLDYGATPRDALYNALFRYWLERHV